MPIVHPAPQKDLSQLVRELANAQEEAMAELYDRTSAAVFALAVRITGNRADAEEVVIDVYTRLWRNADRYEGDRGAVIGWLLMMTRTASIDKLRQNRTQARQAETPASQGYEAASSVPSPEAFAMLEAERQSVREALAALPPEQQEALRLAYYRGLTHVEVAQQLMQPLGTVKTRIRLGLMRMRRLLEAPFLESRNT
jgi:RNA polymerase sigma-70 factor, ECF subfamily